MTSKVAPCQLGERLLSCEAQRSRDAERQQAVRGLLTLPGSAADDLFKFGVNGQKGEPHAFRRDAGSGKLLCKLGARHVLPVAQRTLDDSCGLNPKNGVELELPERIRQRPMHSRGSEIEHPANILGRNKV